jgi:hypothetical protein
MRRWVRPASRRCDWATLKHQVLNKKSKKVSGIIVRELKITCGLVLTIVGLGLYSYYLRELLVALALFSVAFFSLTLVVLSAFLIWCASEQTAVWTPPWSRNVVASSRRLITAYARS